MRGDQTNKQLAELSMLHQHVTVTHLRLVQRKYFPSVLHYGSRFLNMLVSYTVSIFLLCNPVNSLLGKGLYLFRKYMLHYF